MSLDRHHRWDISHPLWWQDDSGMAPLPFTQITAEAVIEGRWRTRRPADLARSQEYLIALERNGRYPHVIWPEHCLIGRWGGDIAAELLIALDAWEVTRGASVQYWGKGENPWTEHFSVFVAEVPDSNDAHTQFNSRLASELAAMDTVFVAGQALSHCVANSVRDLVSAWGGDASRLVLLGDACSSVPGFEVYGERFVEEMSSKGMRVNECA